MVDNDFTDFDFFENSETESDFVKFLSNQIEVYEKRLLRTNDLANDTMNMLGFFSLILNKNYFMNMLIVDDRPPMKEFEKLYNICLQEMLRVFRKQDTNISDFITTQKLQNNDIFKFVIKTHLENLIVLFSDESLLRPDRAPQILQKEGSQPIGIQEPNDYIENEDDYDTNTIINPEELKIPDLEYNNQCHAYIRGLILALLEQQGEGDEVDNTDYGVGEGDSVVGKEGQGDAVGQVDAVSKEGEGEEEEVNGEGDKMVVEGENHNRDNNERMPKSYDDLVHRRAAAKDAFRMKRNKNQDERSRSRSPDRKNGGKKKRTHKNRKNIKKKKPSNKPKTRKRKT
jgi:hypothetical protein